MDGRNSKVTALVRVLLGAGLLYQGFEHFGDPLALAHALGLPLSAALWLALGEFFLGVSLVVGVLSRLCGLLTLLGTLALSVAAGPSGLAALAALGGAYLALRGGGAYSTDRYIGHMQRRVAERELARRNDEG
ncbi:MAG: hypothetical protein HY690_03020 [Chloroflexi bacterium]|nr:hypothetical protein [Chloroflexota bacterium]